jgi:hypothetical protein
MKKQVFLSHAHTDRELYVVPFAKKLDEIGVTYWLDEAEIKWGEKISQKINQGLDQSSFVVVFLTESFIGHNWTETELSAALNRENDEGRVVVLPIVIGDPKVILKNYPMLKDKSYRLWANDLNSIIYELKNSVSSSECVESNPVVPLNNLPKVVKLSKEASFLLKECADDPAGQIVYYSYREGYILQVKNKNLIEDNNERSRVTWVNALEELAQTKLILQIGTNKNLFKITKEGFNLADHLP